jgi:hypothetical protein
LGIDSAPAHVGSRADRFYDSRIGAAAADVSIHSADDFFFRELAVLTLEESHRGKNHSRGAVSALKSFRFKKSLLYGVKMFPPGEPFNGGDLFSRCGTCGSYATPNRGTVEQYGTSPALALTTAVLGSCQFEPVAQDVQERLIGRRVNLVFTSVHDKRESHDLTSREV